MFDTRVVPRHCFSCLVCSKSPRDRGAVAIAFLFPRSKLTCQGLLIPDASIQALFAQGSEFNFRHIEPTGFLWRVVKSEFVHEVMSLFWCKSLREGSGAVRVQIVLDLDQTNALGMRIAFLSQLLHEASIFFFGAMPVCRLLGVAPTFSNLSVQSTGSMLVLSAYCLQSLALLQ